jgi:3-oxoacid CoA-transferase subunit A
MNKLSVNAIRALEGVVKDGSVIAVGGFGLCGVPEALINAVLELGVRGLTIVSNTAGVEDFGVGLLVTNNRVKKVVTSYIGANKELERQYLNNEVEIEFVPQGTLAEGLRAAGAGIPAFYTRTGVGTAVENGKETKEFNGIKYLLEKAIHAEVSLVKAWKADIAGNLVYRYTAKNFNPACAKAGKFTIAEVEEVVHNGDIDPGSVHTPGVFVKKIVVNSTPEKRIEKLRVRC